jgi:FixJ family two-component response regulator
MSVKEEDATFFLKLLTDRTNAGCGECDGFMTSTSSEVTVYILDDDPRARQDLVDLLQSVGLQVSSFASVEEFLKSLRPDARGCLVLDVRLSGLSGLDLQTNLKRSNINIPIIFVSRHADVPMTVQAMKAGAVDFLTKPFREQDILDAVYDALSRDRVQRDTEDAVAGLKVRFASLTPREREVVILVTHGKMNKQVAADLGVSEITVKVNRHNAMKKLGAKSLTELVRIVDMVSA